MTTADLKLSDVIEIAQGLETAKRDSAQLHANDTTTESVLGTVNRLRRGAPNPEATGEHRVGAAAKQTIPQELRV